MIKIMLKVEFKFNLWFLHLIQILLKRKYKSLTL